MRRNDVLKEYLSTLEDKVLGRWCKSGCHGEVIMKLYNEYVDVLLNQAYVVNPKKDCKL